MLTNDTDNDDGLDISSVSISSQGTNGTAVANFDGTITYTHNGSESVSDSFSYTVNDATGAASNIATVNVTIDAVNDSPVANDDSLILDEGTLDTVSVLTNDTDDDDGLDSGSVTIVTAATNGTVVANPDGTINYTHNGTETVSDSFSYTCLLYTSPSPRDS